MIVRDLRPGEASRFEQIRIDCWHAAYTGILLPEVVAGAVLDPRRVAWREARALHPPPDEATLVAEVDGVLAAGAHLWAARDEDLAGSGAVELATLYVDPERRGTGCGAALLEAGFARLPSRSQVLWTFERNAAARRFYERLGFTADGAVRALPLAGEPREVRYRR